MLYEALRALWCDGFLVSRIVDRAAATEPCLNWSVHRLPT